MLEKGLLGIVLKSGDSAAPSRERSGDLILPVQTNYSPKPTISRAKHSNSGPESPNPISSP
ncbi:hypothetical protein I79_006177 [Cricetulus griseus]|uniref:Uncharacterized protein n=1 Tax=Cricetulus griseus TaxID=10029 RepID=G3H751_CRIGR|nr:hypothetical protein I79_006177 [Cricetulus griseus]